MRASRTSAPATPRDLARPVAAVLTGVGIVATRYVPMRAGLEWLPAALLLKLVAGHAVAGAPRVVEVLSHRRPVQ